MYLSIVMPVYNGDVFIVEALKSFFTQYHDQIELIVIDDGSTDDTYKVVSENFKEHIAKGVLVLCHQSNAGVSAARNKAIGMARGKYVTFLDADDILLDNYTNSIIDVIESYDMDVIEFGFKTFIDSDKINSCDEQFVHENFGLIEFKSIKNVVYEKSIWYPCIRAFRKTLFDNYSFPVGVRFCEDMMVLTKIYENVKYVYHIDRTLYGYRINDAGATRNIKPDYHSNLLTFYYSLPKIDAIHIDYIKINLSYLLYKCYNGAKLPLLVRIEFLKLFLKYAFDGNLNSRKKLILGFPNSQRLLKRILKK